VASLARIRLIEPSSRFDAAIKMLVVPVPEMRLRKAGDALGKIP
jgi:hypothetical protein